MFFKSLVRCPYLFESEELSVFIRPQKGNIIKALTFMPNPSFQKQLEKFEGCYKLEESKEMTKKIQIDSKIETPSRPTFNLHPLNVSINDFGVQCRKNIAFLNKFKELLEKMESSFNGDWSSNHILNGFFFEYEKNIQLSYLVSTKNTTKNQFQTAGDTTIISQMAANNITLDCEAIEKTLIGRITEANSLDQNKKLLFENPDNNDIKQMLTTLPKAMSNPYTHLKRYIKWEIMDLEAICESIDSRLDLTKQKNSLGIQITKQTMKLLKLQKGNFQIGTVLKSKEGKVNAISEKQHKIEVF